MNGKTSPDAGALSALKCLEREVAPYTETLNAERPRRWMAAAMLVAIGLIVGAVLGWAVQQARVNELERRLGHVVALERKVAEVTAAHRAAEQRIETLKEEIRPKYWYEDWNMLLYRDPFEGRHPIRLRK
jgi:hypothetical protein